MIRLTVLVASVGLCLSSAWAASPQAGSKPIPKVRPVFGALDPVQLSQVQAVSRAVLAVKGSTLTSIEEEGLLAELHSLAGSVEQALQLNAVNNNPKLAPTTALSESVGAPGVPSRPARLNNLLSPHVARLHERRAAINSLPVVGDEVQQQAVAHVQHLAVRAGALEQSVQDALNATDETERFARLTDLKSQLRPRNLAELWQDREAEAALAAENTGAAAALPASTPTMTTLIQHRLGLDDLRRGKH